MDERRMGAILGANATVAFTAVKFVTELSCFSKVLVRHDDLPVGRERI
jgi:hypothetical protein